MLCCIIVMLYDNDMDKIVHCTFNIKLWIYDQCRADLDPNSMIWPCDKGLTPEKKFNFCSILLSLGVGYTEAKNENFFLSCLAPFFSVACSISRHIQEGKNF